MMQCTSVFESSMFASSFLKHAMLQKERKIQNESYLLICSIEIRTRTRSCFVFFNQGLRLWRELMRTETVHSYTVCLFNGAKAVGPGLFNGAKDVGPGLFDDAKDVGTGIGLPRPLYIYTVVRQHK
jgi:hypothetical protein